ncbi:MAG: hypothetical protein L6Q98_19200 [Anaerolineae bacterium]|nr:hypothetical protein [Anaerolineae bacterium]NUQ04871.1 hypothetical protein [Anaerolineae bacterium]
MTRRTRFAPHALAALGLCLFAFAMSAILSRTVFERLPHLEDEYAYLFQARTLARGDLVVESPPVRRAYWLPFLLYHDDVRFGKYTPGWPLLLAGGVIAGQEWMVNALLAALTVALVYRLGSDLFGRDTGLIAAALTAFSPMALLLNATLMGHTAALCCGALAFLAYLRLEQSLMRLRGERRFVLALIVGLALGLLAAARPLTAAAFALPLMARASAWLLGRWSAPLGGLRAWLVPHLIIAAVALAVFAIVPIYNVAAVGDPTANLYARYWEYDCVGFAGCGRSGHTLERAFRHTRFDLSLTAADLFGWQSPLPLTDEAAAHLLNDGDTYPIPGYSWALLPFGVLIGLRRRWWLGALWLIGLAGAALFAMHYDDGRLLTSPDFAWAWVIGALVWTLLPVLALRERRAAWTWILLATAALVIGLQLTYWIGSQRYSTRYYFEGLAAAALLSAVPLGSLISRLSAIRPSVARRAFYGGLAALLLVVLFVYALPRVALLRGYNRITRDLIDQVNARREGDRPVLVLVTGEDVRWRAYGALMASTSPYLDSPIVAAWDYSNGTDPAVRQAILDRFPDRQVIEMGASINDSWFIDDPPG